MYDFKSLPLSGGAKMPNLGSRFYAKVKIHIRNARIECRTKLEINTTLTHTQRIELAAQIEAYKTVLQILDEAEEAQELDNIQQRQRTAEGQQAQVEKTISSIDGWFTSHEISQKTGAGVTQVQKILNELYLNAKLERRDFSRKTTRKGTDGWGAFYEYRCYVTNELAEAGDD